MSSNFIEIIIPSATFFAAFFLLFAILEMSLALSLNWLIFRLLGHFYVPSKDPRICRWLRIGESTAILFIFIVAAACCARTLDAVAHSSIEIQIFSIEFLLAIVLTFILINQEIIEDKLIRKAHRCLYVLTSSISLVIVVLLANAFYMDYKNYIHTAIAIPLGTETEFLEKIESQKLIEAFRPMVLNQQCPEADFSSYYTGTRLVSFVYLLTQADLSTSKKPMIPTDVKAHTSGRLCSNGKHSFLLTDHGQWYWVVIGEEMFKSKSAYNQHGS